VILVALLDELPGMDVGTDSERPDTDAAGNLNPILDAVPD
jgi:hypothetical protein